MFVFVFSWARPETIFLLQLDNNAVLLYFMEVHNMRLPTSFWTNWNVFIEFCCTGSLLFLFLFESFYLNVALLLVWNKTISVNQLVNMPEEDDDILKFLCFFFFTPHSLVKFLDSVTSRDTIAIIESEGRLSNDVTNLERFESHILPVLFTIFISTHYELCQKLDEDCYCSSALMLINVLTYNLTLAGPTGLIRSFIFMPSHQLCCCHHCLFSSTNKATI